MAPKEHESSCESLRLEILDVYERAPLVGNIGVKKRLTKHSAIAKEARQNILRDKIRAAYREATRELFPGDPTSLDPSDAGHLITEEGLSGRVRRCAADGIPTLKERLVEEMRGMEVVMNDGRPMVVRIRRSIQ